MFIGGRQAQLICAYLHGGWLDLLDMEHVGLVIDGIQVVLKTKHLSGATKQLLFLLGYEFPSDASKKAKTFVLPWRG